MKSKSKCCCIKTDLLDIRNISPSLKKWSFIRCHYGHLYVSLKKWSFSGGVISFEDKPGNLQITILLSSIIIKVILT